MNRIERRIAGTNGARPGVPVCSPGTQQNNVGMLGRGSVLYNSAYVKKTQNTRHVNGLSILQNQGDRINRLEQKVEQLEQMNVMNISSTDAEFKKKDKTIDLMNAEFRITINELRSYIKELQIKIKRLDGDIPIVTAVRKEPIIIPSPPKILENRSENIRLEITET